MRKRGRIGWQSLGAGLLCVGAFWLGFWGRAQWQKLQPPPAEPVIPEAPPRPLLKYTLPNLAQLELTPGVITLEEVISETNDLTMVSFSYLTEDGKVAGLATFGRANLDVKGTIIMLRGWAPRETYITGTGTRASAAAYVNAGYQTFAPDFLGYAGSDPEPADPWQTRFEKPLQIKQLITNLKAGQFQCWQTLSAQTNNPLVAQYCASEPVTTLAPVVNVTALNNLETVGNLETVAHEATSPPQLTSPTTQAVTGAERLGLWGHSNGGQITLCTIEILGEPIPARISAPVAVGFPYSVLYFTDEEEDEGKQSRKFISLLEDLYNADDFSHTRHLDLIPPGAPLLIHHGTADVDAPIAWSDELVTKIKIENELREKRAIAPIELSYHRYPGVNHNLYPNDGTIIARDLAFFDQYVAASGADAVEK